MSGNYRYDGHSSLGRDMAHLGDYCPADQVAAHPWIAELHSLSTNAGEKMVTAFEKTEDYVLDNPNKTLVGLFGTAYLSAAVLPKVAAEIPAVLPPLVIGGIALGVADLAVVDVTGKMLGCRRVT